MERRKEEDRPRQDDIATGDENWGKEDGTIRLAFQNVNSLGFDEGQINIQRIFNFLHKYNIDKLGIAEVNIYWKKEKRPTFVGQNSRMARRTTCPHKL